MKTTLDSCELWIKELQQKRRGVFIVVMAVSLSVCLAFVAFSVDTGIVVLTQTRMQNCVDAAALAAANEISHAVETAGSNVTDVSAYAIQQARLKAQSMGALNEIYIDPNLDVEFGRWSINAGTGVSSIQWGVTPANAVRVTARRTGSDTSQPDGKLKTLFAGAFGAKSVSISSQAVAYIESRDIGLVLDYSSSMNDDSSYDVLGTRDRTQLDTNMELIYNQLDAVRDFGSMTFTPRWFEQSVTAGIRNGTAKFKNTSIDVTSSTAMSGVDLVYSDDSTETKTASGTSATVTSSSSKTIKKATVKIPGTLAPTTGSQTTSGQTSTVLFNNSAGTTLTDTTSSNMTEIRLNYADGSTDTFTFTSTKSKTVNGDNGKYVVSARAKIGTTYVTVANPAGATEPVTFAAQSLVFEPTGANVQAWLGLPTYPWDSGSWTEFTGYCQTNSQINSAGHKHKYGGACLVNYLLKNKYTYASCNDLWRTSHYPFHSVKQGAQLFCDFLEDLSFGDEVGAVSFDVNARREDALTYDGYSINITANPICNDFASVRQIVGHRQAAHYSSNTNIGAGIYTARLMLDASKRPGTRPTLLVMTDGEPTASDSSGWTNPNWTTAQWNELFDYDGDGTANYTTTNTHAIYGLVRAKEAVDAGYTIHTLTVGLGADPAYMEAIAHLGGGITIVVPGDQTVSEMEADVIAGFQKIAAFVPPARLVKNQ